MNLLIYTTFAIWNSGIVVAQGFCNKASLICVTRWNQSIGLHWNTESVSQTMFIETLAQANLRPYKMANPSQHEILPA